MDKNTNDKSSVRSVQRAVDILEALKDKIPEKTVTELSRELGLSPTTIYRLLGTLKERGFIEKDANTAKYRLGMKAFELGSAVVRRMNIRKEAEPILMELAEKTGDSAYLIVPYQDEALCLERIDGDNYLKSLSLVLGDRMPLHIGAGPRVLLAHLPESEIDRIIASKGLARWTDKTITDPFILKEDLRQVREQGYALSLEDANKGVAAIGCPVRDRTGKVVASISVGGPSIYFEPESVDKMVPLIKKAAENLSRRLGYGVNQE
ncbi:IclR family transcriptional regulator [Candidatus Aerophobetes bacterium]|nr:IclR family transcriptional regulator [Candidatus Aerophobetes bacterium]